MTRRCRDCKHGPLGNNNTSGYCLPCGRRHRCVGCRRMAPVLASRRCADCVAARPVKPGKHRGAPKHKTPPFVAERIARYAAHVAAGGRLFEGATTDAR